MWNIWKGGTKQKNKWNSDMVEAIIGFRVIYWELLKLVNFQWSGKFVGCNVEGPMEKFENLEIFIDLDMDELVFESNWMYLWRFWVNFQVSGNFGNYFLSNLISRVARGIGDLGSSECGLGSGYKPSLSPIIHKTWLNTKMIVQLIILSKLPQTLIMLLNSITIPPIIPTSTTPISP